MDQYEEDRDNDFIDEDERDQRIEEMNIMRNEYSIAEQEDEAHYD